jgi:hypothetical protein
VTSEEEDSLVPEINNITAQNSFTKDLRFVKHAN